MSDVRSRSRLHVGRWAALALVAASLAIPASGSAYYDGGGPASDPAPASQFPTANQIAEHRGVAPGAFLSTDAPASDDGANGANTVLILVAAAALLVAIRFGIVAMTTYVRARRSPQPSV